MVLSRRGEGEERSSGSRPCVRFLDDDGARQDTGPRPRRQGPWPRVESESGRGATCRGRIFLVFGWSQRSLANTIPTATQGKEGRTSREEQCLAALLLRKRVRHKGKLVAIAWWVARQGKTRQGKASGSVLAAELYRATATRARYLHGYPNYLRKVGTLQAPVPCWYLLSFKPSVRRSA